MLGTVEHKATIGIKVATRVAALAQWRFHMRLVIGFAVLIAALTAAVESASAQNRPWCLRSGFTGPGWCGFDSFRQCMATASGQGGSCIENNMLIWQRQQDQQKKNAKRQGRQDDGRGEYR